MVNVLFKISYPAEFHAQAGVGAAHIFHHKTGDMGNHPTTLIVLSSAPRKWLSVSLPNNNHWVTFLIDLHVYPVRLNVNPQRLH